MKEKTREDYLELAASACEFAGRHCKTSEEQGVYEFVAMALHWMAEDEANNDPAYWAANYDPTPF